MLATCEKRPMTAMSNMAYYRRLTIVLALFCALPIATLAQTADTPQNPPPPLGQLVDVGGYRVHLYCTGTGRPSVVIVGAGYSFDWGLVQSEVAKFTQVCVYDHSGIAWGDGGPKDSCSLWVTEVHAALKSAGIKGPYVFVGHSLGALVARTYAGRYLDEVAGIVFVDHAFSLIRLSLRTDKAQPPMPPQMPSTPGGGRGPVIFGMESDPNFSKLSSRDRELHVGRGGGDRKLNPLSQVLSCQRRSTAALLPIGVKWCQIPRTAHDRSVLAISTRSDLTLPVMRQTRHVSRTRPDRYDAARDLAPSFVTKCRERFHARGPQRGNVGGEHGGHTEHDE